MSIPKPVYNPPFNVTRASHSVLTVKDLAVSRNFYVDLLGFIVSDEDRETLYLRGVAEACHHSLVLKRARGEPQAERVGMRVFSEEDLEKAKVFFDKAGLPATWLEVSHQGAPCTSPTQAARRSSSARPWRSSHASSSRSSTTTARCRSGSIISSSWFPTCSAHANSG